MRWLDLEVDSAERLVDELVYSSYRHNRTITPVTTPAQWREIFGAQTDALEARYQKELADERQDALMLAELERRSGCGEE